MPTFTDKMKHILQQHSTSLQRGSYHLVPGIFNMLRYAERVFVRICTVSVLACCYWQVGASVWRCEFFVLMNHAT